MKRNIVFLMPVLLLCAVALDSCTSTKVTLQSQPDVSYRVGELMSVTDNTGQSSLSIDDDDKYKAFGYSYQGSIPIPFAFDYKRRYTTTSLGFDYCMLALWMVSWPYLMWHGQDAIYDGFKYLPIQRTNEDIMFTYPKITYLDPPPQKKLVANYNQVYTSSNTGEKQNIGYSQRTLPDKTTVRDNVEPGLLYKGDYTVSGLGSTEYPTISIYENQLCASIECFDYKSTNSNGERVYKGTETFGAECTYYVSENYNIRLVKSYYNPYTSGYDNVTFSVTKGTSRMPAQQGGYAPAGDNEGYQWKEHGTTNNPVQPHQVTTSCSSCQGSGKCSTCNGKHWYYGIGGSKVTCPNCTPNGACSSCGGSGKKTTTKYY